MTDFHHGRHAGVLLPLFSAVSSRSWGIGEIADLLPLCGWLDRAGFDFVLLLPVNEMAGGEHSPYSALSAMAIDPIYISVWSVDEFAQLGGEDAFPEALKQTLDEVRRAPRIDYVRVRALKQAALRTAFDRFLENEWRRTSPRAALLSAFIEDERWWIDDYCLFRVLRDRARGAPWWEWPAPLAARDADALRNAREDYRDDVLFYQYLQWIADRQWRDARRAVRPVGLFGDLPFMVGRDSADVWARQEAFDFTATIGTPPDDFSATGQDWGLPVYRWDVFARQDDAWIRDRARRSAELYDAYRVDHLVGFYRTYAIPVDGGPRSFRPPDQPSQVAQGERVMAAFASAGALVIAEDLGTVPPFVHRSIERLGIPGYKVLRWERNWNLPGHPFTDPAAWRPASVATSGTHDTETLAEWWESALPDERRAASSIPGLRGLIDPSSGAFTPAIRDALLELLYAASSNYLVLPMADLFGWRDRINTPATVGEHNWTWRLPWRIDRADQEPAAVERAATLKTWAARHGRVVTGR